ncbi:lipopolysaccharide transport periplasmic protein LptA [Litoribacillus peritrichatus]|uniref:Lipopolysaccharide export system protein LptA n=1 Tax=Litoribacillus peritrichatus TaxID=718191 RepID=A0ABP7N8X0_9GAMM
MKFNNKRLTALLIALSFSASLWALPEDKTQPIKLEADQAKMNNKTGVSEYTGNVIIIQGTAELRADKVFLYSENNEVTRMEAFGSPAKYQQILNPGEEPTHIEGNKLDLKVKENNAIVTGNGKVFRGEDVLESNKITYSLDTGELKASASDPKTNPGDSRVKFIINPQIKDKSSDSEPQK